MERENLPTLSPEILKLLEAERNNAQPDPKPATWENIEQAALFDPILHRLVTAVRDGLVDREQGLMVVALKLSAMNTALLKDNANLLARLPSRHFLG